MSAYISWADGAFKFDAVLTEGHVLDSEVTTHPVEKGIDISDNVRLLPKIVTITGIISQAPVYAPTFSLQPTMPLELFNLSPQSTDPKYIQRPPSTQTISPPQPPLLFSLNSAFNAGMAFLGGTSFSLQTSAAALDTDPRYYSFSTYQSSTQTDYIVQAYDILRNLQASNELLTVFGGGGLLGSQGSQDHTCMYENMILKTLAFDRPAGVGGAAHFTLTLHEIRIISSSIVAAPTPTAALVNATPAVSTGAQAPKTPVKEKTVLRAAATGGAPAPGVSVQ